jgi:hypothetical protein
MWNMFEYPFVGAGIAVIAMLGLWLVGIFSPQNRHRWHPVIPFAILLLSFAIEFLVQTDREKILGTVKKGIEAFETQKIEPIREIIAEDYSDLSNSSKEELLAYCQALFQTAMVGKITLYSRKIEINGAKATFTAKALVKFDANSSIAQMGKEFLLVKARFYFKRAENKKWLVYNSEVLELDGKAVNWNLIKGM